MKNTIIKKSLSIIFTLTLTLSIAGCAKKTESSPASSDSSSQSKVETKLDKVKKAGKLVLGTSADYPPYEFHTTVNGKDEIVGFDVTIAKEIAKDLGVTLEIKDMKFDGLLAALDAGNIDMVVAGMTPTEERKKSVDFSNIYYKAVQTLIVRTADKDKLTKIDDLKGKKVGAQKGSVQEGIVKDQMPNSEAKLLGKVTDLVLELKNSKVDALVMELPVANSYVSKNKDLAISQIKFSNEDQGSAVAVKKNSPELVEAINKTLDRLAKDKSIDKFVTEANDMVE